MSAVKIATSVPAAQFEAVEAVRASLGMMRSAVVQEALAMWLATQSSSRRVAEYMRGYLAMPEDAAESSAIVEAWADGLESEDWG
jgi:uncharacterized protein YdbL (DUF1318 family)